MTDGLEPSTEILSQASHEDHMLTCGFHIYRDCCAKRAATQEYEESVGEPWPRYPRRERRVEEFHVLLDPGQ